MSQGAGVGAGVPRGSGLGWKCRILENLEKLAASWEGFSGLPFVCSFREGQRHLSSQRTERK